jgi:hypothetical protein
MYGIAMTPKGDDRTVNSNFSDGVSVYSYNEIQRALRDSIA